MTQVQLISCGVMVAALGAVQTRAQEAPAEYREVLSVLGRQGDYKAGVLKVNIPRNDLKVTVANVSTPTRMGLNTWAAFVGTDDRAAIAGDIAMLAAEITPV